MKKNLFLIITALIFNSCSFFNFFGIDESAPIQEIEIKLNEKYQELSNEYFILLENPIEDSQRKLLLNKFEKLKFEIEKLKNTRKNKKIEEEKVFKSYSDKVDLNIQYLNDLAD